MRIIIDADAVPSAVKEILFRASVRNRIPLIMVANIKLKHPASEYISSVVVSAGPDEADDYIAEMTIESDLVITADIPLADRVVSKGGCALNPRGAIYTKENIKERLAMRDLMDELRNGGIDTGGPAPFTDRDRREFANSLDTYIRKKHP
jgi:hypothetical protein